MPYVLYQTNNGIAHQKETLGLNSFLELQAQPLKDKSFHSPRTRRASGQPDGTTDSLTKHICTLRLTADHRLWDYMYRKNDKVDIIHVLLLLERPNVREQKNQLGDRNSLHKDTAKDGSRLWCLTVSLSLSHWYPGSGVVLDCIDS